MTKEQVLFKPFPKQEEFLADLLGNEYDITLYGGAIRGGKTFAGLGGLLLLCRLYPGSRWAVVRDSLPTLRRTTISSFWKVVPERFIRWYNQSIQTVEFTNTSQIIFFPENYDQDKELNRWKGLEVNGFLLEELNELQEASFWKAVERAGSHIIPGGKKQPPRKIAATCNPTKGWVKGLFYDRDKDGTLPPKWKYIQSRIYDNPYIPESYKEGLKEMPRYQYEVFVEGNWEVNLKRGGEFYKSFDLDTNIAPCRYNSLLPLHVSFDENVHPFSACTIHQAVGKRVMQIDEICLKSPQNTLEDVCDEFLARYGDNKEGLFIYGDATSRKADVKLKKGHNFFTLIDDRLAAMRPMRRVPMSNPSVVMRGQFINAVFEKNYDDCKIIIGEHCVNTIEDYTNCKESGDGVKDKKKTTDPKSGVRYEEWGHCTDANDYIYCEILKNSFILYSKGTAASIVRPMGRPLRRHGF